MEALFASPPQDGDKRERMSPRIHLGFNVIVAEG